MYKTMREKDLFNKQIGQSPSFSSSLLDEIYRSIDLGTEKTLENSKFYRENPMRKQSNISKKRHEAAKMEHEEKRAVKKMPQNSVQHKNQRKLSPDPRHRRRHHHHHHHHDVMFFTSNSSSSDSSSYGFSSSETELVYAKRATKPSCFKPIRTGVPGKSEKAEKKIHVKDNKKQSNLCYENRETRYFDDYGFRSTKDYVQNQEEDLTKSKTRAMKIYNNLKKVKQPISPGGKLASFISSLFTAANTKRSSNVTDGSVENPQDSIKSECSTASSYTRSCLSKHSPSTRQRLRNGVKRNVSFYPVSVIVDEDLKPCGHKSLYPEEEFFNNASSLVSVSVPSAWKIGKTPTRKSHREEIKVQVMEKSRRVDEMARDILREYGKKDAMVRHDDDDDGMSCSSSELFELDVMGNGRYLEELPVYETTHVETNRAIANGLIM